MGPKREIRNHIICENKKFRHKCFIHISIICFKSKNIKMGSFLLCLGLKPISPRMVLAVGNLGTVRKRSGHSRTLSDISCAERNLSYHKYMIFLYLVNFSHLSSYLALSANLASFRYPDLG